MKDSPENVHIIESLGLVIVTHNDLLNKQSVERVINELKGNPFFKEEYLILINIKNAEIKPSSEEIEDLSDFVYGNFDETGPKKFAILTSSSQIDKAVKFVRYYKISSKYQVFSNLDAALNWLKIPQARKSQVEIKMCCLNDL